MADQLAQLKPVALKLITARPDLASIGGLVLSVGGILGGLLLEGGKIRDVAQITAALIVLGGTIGAVMVTTPLRVLMRAIQKLGIVFVEKSQQPQQAVDEIISFATKARKHGIVSLEQDADRVPDEFLRKALNLAVDGTDLDAIRKMMELEMTLEEHGAEAEAKVYEAAGGYAPTVGIIGAVLGLIQVMKHLENIDEVGRGIAVAFVANVSLAGVTDPNTFVTNINNAIQAAGLGGTQYTTAFKNAGINAAINTDSSGRQQLTFTSSTAAFQVEAGDRMANALLGNFVGGTGPTGKDLANTITGAATINAALVTPVIVRIQGAGLASPVDITLASGLSGQGAIDSLNSQVATNTALQAAGITVNDPTVTGTIAFTSKRGEAFSVSAEGDTKNTLGLGTFYKSAAATFDYSTITAGAAITTGGTQTDVLEFSVGGGPVQQISVTLLAADTAAQINDKINSQLAANSVLKSAGIGSTQGAGIVTLASTNTTAFRVREAGGVNANAVLGFATTVTSVAIGQGGASDTALTVGDNTDNAHFNAGGVSTTAAFKFSPLVYGQDSQTVTFSANDSSGAAHTTQVVLQNAVGVGTANARSLDEAIASINTKLQSSNDTTLQRIVAVKDYIDANLAAAESRIRDADLAAEAANLTKAQILLQAGTAAVAQANSSSQAVLALLR